MAKRIRRWIRWRIGLHRLRFGFCPVCNSSPPDISCPVCKGSRDYGRKPDGSISWEHHCLWVERFRKVLDGYK